MSSTRTAHAGPLRQDRFASSPEFERGLLANLVARRCSVIDQPEGRALIWSIHKLSHELGLKAVAAALLAGGYIGTTEMRRIGKGPGQAFTAEEVRRVRRQLPDKLKLKFRLRGETREALNPLAKGAKLARNLAAMRDGNPDGIVMEERRVSTTEAGSQPTFYPVESFLSVCRAAAESSLEEDIQRLCLDPSMKIEDGHPWYFAWLVSALRAHVANCLDEQTSDLVITEIGRLIGDALDYTKASRFFTLIEGNARIGKSFAARAWVDLHPGQARFVEVPPGNDDSGFFRALSRGLGLGSFTKYKAVELRERVESVLLSGDILLCLDEAQRLWLQGADHRYGFAKRINWVMSMANQGVPICGIATPQFLTELKVKEEKAGWNSAQFQGRLGHYEPLPTQLSTEDLTAVARKLLPEADKPTVRALAAYARTSARYLAAIESIVKRARYIAGRETQSVNAEHVRRAMQESVIPSDSKLVQAMERKPKGAIQSEVPTTRALMVDSAINVDLRNRDLPTDDRNNKPVEHFVH